MWVGDVSHSYDRNPTIDCHDKNPKSATVVKISLSTFYRVANLLPVRNLLQYYLIHSGLLVDEMSLHSVKIHHRFFFFSMIKSAFGRWLKYLSQAHL